jgi:hypothetical protein
MRVVGVSIACRLWSTFSGGWILKPSPMRQPVVSDPHPSPVSLMMKPKGSHEVALKPLGSSEGKQLKGLVKLLQKRLAEQKAFLPNEMEKLRYLDRKRRRWGEGRGQVVSGDGEKGKDPHGVLVCCG